MLTYRSALIAGLLMASSVQAETPNIEPGNWRYQSQVSFVSDFPIPEQNETSTNCITQEQIDKGDAFIEDTEGCELTTRDIRSDRMKYVMECANQGTNMVMNAEVKFMGDRMEGKITGDMQSAMGAMKMNVTMTGQRIGDCPTG